LANSTSTEQTIPLLDGVLSSEGANEITAKVVPIYTNTTRMPNESNMVYSSTMCILQGIRTSIEHAAKNYYDKALQIVILTASSDEATDFATLRQRQKNESQILLPAMAISLDSYKFMYAPSNNIERFANYYYNGSGDLTTYIAIPTEFSLTMRYYTTNYDLLLRFSENLAVNSQLGTKGQFTYMVLDQKGQVQYVQGYIVVDADNSNHKPKQLSLRDKSKGDVWAISVPVWAWGCIVSHPYPTRSVSVPQVNIDLQPSNLKSQQEKQKQRIDRFVNIFVPADKTSF